MFWALTELTEYYKIRTDDSHATTV